MTGCHKCEHFLKPGTSYESSSCSKCNTRKSAPFTAWTQCDPALYTSSEAMTEMHPAYSEADAETERKNAILNALARCVIPLVRLAIEKPETWRVVLLKLQHPLMSYTEIAEAIGCRKQNVFYHIRLALKTIPVLADVLTIDSRFIAPGSGLLRARKKRNNGEAAR